ncbi:MAG: DMT family transporter [Bacteroidales bacterium]|jgi:drug/metabolite transporter (DMT)-like permease|nr:DMT family transporter [Bacteroidales bacterium]HOI31783.1 DMT family transporter [Bacteroidales bacterium]
MANSERSVILKGSIAIAISAVLWGIDGVVLTPRLFNLEVGYVVFILHAFPFLLMNLFLFRHYRYLPKMPISDIFLFFLISLLGGAIGTLAIVKALFLLNFNHLSVVVLLQKLQPVFAIFLARTILGEKLKQRFLLWASLAIVAGYFLTFGWGLPDTNTDLNTIYAALLALLAAFSFGSSTVLSKKILGNYSFVTSTFYRYGFTSIIMLAFMIIWGDFAQFGVTTTENWFFIILIGLTTGSGAIFLYYYGLRKVKAILATISELMFPLSAVIFDYFINDSLLTPVQWLAAIAMLLAIFRLNSEPEKIV